LSTADLVARLRSLKVKLWIEDERLRCNAPKGMLTDALRHELAVSKPALMAWLQENGGIDGALPASPADGASLDDAPLSFAQQRIWFIEQMQPGGHAYNIAGAIRMGGKLVVAALESSIGAVLRRHAPLRSIFATVDGQPYQRVMPVDEFRLPIVDLRSRPSESRQRDIDRLLVEEGRVPFDLEKGPLFRARLLHLAPDDYLLQVTVHHILSDGWSLAVFAKELTALYPMHLDGPSGDLPPLPLSYAEIACRQREKLRGPVLQTLETYWKTRLAAPPPVLELPTDYPRPALQSFNGDVESFRLSAAQVDLLQRVGREHGATLFMTLLAAFGVILHRYTGMTDIALGVPIANRKNVEEEAVIGLLMNTLVMRMDFSGDPTFRELLLRVRDLALDDYAHQDLPFARLVEILKPPRDLSHSVLYQVMFIFQNLPSQVVRLPGLTLSYPPIRLKTAKTDLSLEVVEREDGLEMFFEYNTDLFAPDTIQRLCGHFQTLLTAIVADPSQPVARLPLLSEEERRLITVGWNATETPEPLATTVAQIFEAQAQRRPDLPAVRFEAERLTYGELNGRANRLARQLQTLGIGPNALVGIFLERSLEMLVSLVAVMKAGGTYVPLDPDYPADRLEFMIEDAGIGLVITKAPLLNRISMPGTVRALCLDRDASDAADEAEQNPGAAASADDLAYIIYTSGSTGRPKGVQVAHRSVVNLLAAFQGALEVRESDVLAAVTTLSFDIAALELLLPLVTGAELVIAARDVVIDPIRLASLIAEAGATIMQATPTTWRILLEAGWRNGKGLRILCGGEAFPAELAAPLLATGASLWNVYGPTESTIWSTIHRVTGAENPVAIGRPIANTRAYILDSNGEPTPIGVPGELYLGGTGIAKGYLNRAGLTLEKFVADPFSSDAAARLYRTGDIARYRADGCLEFLGRADHQVKIRGFRIELGEIETLLASHPALAQAVVVARENRPGERSLAAYARLAGTKSLLYPELRAFLGERLPDYMIPSSLTVLKAFPLTPNGKVDRRQLPEPEAQRADPAVPHLAPRSGHEQAIAAVWRDVLRLEELGIDDNFFDLGGHSLLVVQVQARLRETLRRDMSIVEMFQYPTIRSIAAHLERQAASCQIA
jgi:amino acid adenylation domain-containing protein